MTTGSAGDTLKYYFTTAFFDLVEIAKPIAKTVEGGLAVFANHEQSNYNKLNNKIGFQKFKNSNSVQGIVYKSPEETKQDLEQSLNIKAKDEQKSPYNDKNTAIEFMEQLKLNGKNDINKMIISKLVRLWDL